MDDTTDYPRVCGGTPGSGVQVEQGEGLSPRVRGNPLMVSVILPLERTIPACAGEPRYLQSLINEIMDYPRVCGGTADCIGCHCLDSGLSPRVRGNQWSP